MPRASQLHKLNVRGTNSQGDRKGLQYTKAQHGTDTVPAILVIEGLWSSTDTITVNTDIGAGNVQSQYSPSSNETPQEAATGLAAIINGQPDHTAVASVNHVEVTKTTAGTVEIVNASIA